MVAGINLASRKEAVKSDTTIECIYESLFVARKKPKPRTVEELLSILHIMCFPNGGIAKALAGWIISVRIRGIKDTGSTPS